MTTSNTLIYNKWAFDKPVNCTELDVGVARDKMCNYSHYICKGLDVYFNYLAIYLNESIINNRVVIYIGLSIYNILWNGI